MQEVWQDKRISVGAVLRAIQAAAASRLPSRTGRGCFPIQFQKRGISNCPGKPEFCQRGQNSSRSDMRLLRSSDRPLGTAKFRFPGTVRNIRRFFLWIGKHPRPVREGRRLATAAWMARRTAPTLMRLSRAVWRSECVPEWRQALLRTAE